jgi:hypothetical protein
MGALEMAKEKAGQAPGHQACVRKAGMIHFSPQETIAEAILDAYQQLSPRLHERPHFPEELQLKITGISPFFPCTYPFQNAIRDDEVEGLVEKGWGETTGLNKLDIANPFLLQTGANELDSFRDGLQRVDLLYRVSQGVGDCAVPASHIERAGATLQAEQGHPGCPLKIQNGG